MAVVDEDEAMRRAIRAFYEQGDFKEYEKSSGKKSKFGKSLFDGYEKELRKSLKKKQKGKELEVPEEDEDEGEE